MCGLRIRPRTDVDPPRVEVPSAGGISSRRHRGDNFFCVDVKPGSENVPKDTEIRATRRGAIVGQRQPSNDDSEGEPNIDERLNTSPSPPRRSDCTYVDHGTRLNPAASGSEGEPNIDEGLNTSPSRRRDCTYVDHGTWLIPAAQCGSEGEPNIDEGLNTSPIPRRSDCTYVDHGTWLIPAAQCGSEGEPNIDEGLNTSPLPRRSDCTYVDHGTRLNPAAQCGQLTTKLMEQNARLKDLVRQLIADRGLTVADWLVR